MTNELTLVPAKTVVNAKGDGMSVDVSGATGRVFLVTLSITKIIEQESLDVSIFGSAEPSAEPKMQESLDVSIFGSADGSNWSAKSIAAFSQKFYSEESPLLLDLTARPDVNFVRAHWEVARWGRGTETPRFEFGVTMREVPSDILREATREAKAIA